jgi:FkbM family methyltransferase
MNCIKELIERVASQVADPETLSLVNRFISGEEDVARYVIGKNEMSEHLCRSTDIDGVVDDYSSGGTWENTPILAIGDLPSNAIVVNCSLSISPLKVKSILDKADIEGHFFYCHLNDVDSAAYPLPVFSRDFRADLVENENEWNSLYETLADRESASVFRDVMALRLSANPEFMTGYSNRPEEQYFEEFLDLDNCKVFIDVGGFDGDTTESMLKRHPACEKVHLFEPSSKNLGLARKRLSAYNNVVFHQFGLSEKSGQVSFADDCGASSSVADEGGDVIEVTTLDSWIHEPVSFVKMDIEGLEKEALAGSEKHILADRPKLAIAGYHFPEDLRAIFKYVTGLHSDYKVYLRHYTEGISETIIFFV